MITKNASKKGQRVLIALMMFVALVGSSVLVSAPVSAQKGAKKPPKTNLDKLTISCGTSSAISIDIHVCAGTSGVPAGFSIQWMTKEDFDALGGTWPMSSEPGNLEAPSFCKASFSGVPGCSQYNLGASGCITVNIGDNLFDDCGASSPCSDLTLDCDTEYVFRAFAHNDPQGLAKSEWSDTLTCSTMPCGGGDTNCTFGQGYWKSHGPGVCMSGMNSNVWPVTSLTLGSVMYTDAELCSIFNMPAAGNGLISLAHQLMAAKLNIANGADGSSIAAAITAADALIGSLVVPPVGSGFLHPSVTDGLITTLTAFNEGLSGPGACEDD